jgi:predicted aspartyl protease
MIIRRDIMFQGTAAKRVCNVLFDSGATLSFIREDIGIALGQLNTIPKPYHVQTAVEGQFMLLDKAVLGLFTLEGHELYDVFVLMPGQSEEVVIGVDTLQKYHCKLDFETGAIFVHPEAGKLMLI